MDGFPKKAVKTVKTVLLFILEHWPTVTLIFGGITLAGIIAALGRFIDFFGRLVKLTIRLEVPLLAAIVILPFILYAVIMVVIRWIDVLRKPPYLSFTTMEYKNWKLRWDYKPTKGYEYYEIVKIRPVCHKCGCELTKISAGGGVEGLCCPSCEDRWYETFDKRDAVEKIIEHKIENRIFQI